MRFQPATTPPVQEGLLYNAGAVGVWVDDGTRNIQTKDESENDKSLRNIVRAHEQDKTDKSVDKPGSRDVHTLGPASRPHEPSEASTTENRAALQRWIAATKGRERVRSKPSSPPCRDREPSEPPQRLPQSRLQPSERLLIQYRRDRPQGFRW